MKTFIIFLTILFTHCSYSLDTTSTKYFPLNNGNVYVYRYFRIWSNYDTTINTIVKVVITDSSVINSHIYYNFISTSNFMNQVKFRVDSTTGNKMKYSSTFCSYYGYEVLDDWLAAMLHDTFWTGCHDVFPNDCYFIGPVQVFGVQTEQKGLRYSQPHSFRGRTYTKFFGLTRHESTVYYQTDLYIMKGCIINSVLYGDTSTIVGEVKLNEEVPFLYNLSQNYPNPFNPVTRIKYDVPKSSLVRIIIYNVLGREIETLVNEMLKPGSYEVTWDGSRYASGVYFYKLVTDEYVETRKMVLIK